MWIYLFIVAAVCARFLVALPFVPHWANFAPVSAMVLFAAAHMKPRQLWFPMAAIIASDFVLTPLVYKLPAGPDQYFTWAAYGLILSYGLSLRKQLDLARLGGITLGSSVTFFAISNFGTWAAWGLYPHTWGGLLACYTAALPFFRNTVISDLLFVTAFFGVYALATRRRAEAVSLTA